MYHIDNGMWGRVFAVPNEIADKHLKLCGAVSLKVLLLLLRHGEPLDATQLAAMLGQSPADIHDAANYWIELGVIAGVDGNSPVSDGLPSAPANEPVQMTIAAPVRRSEELPGGNKLVQLGRARRLTTEEVNELAEGDSGVRNLLHEAQAALGRPLKPLESESIVTVYARFEMPTDIILMLLHYCISVGKTGTTHLERMAENWYSRDINTHEKAEQELLRLGHQDETDNSIRKIFGVYGRKITDKERIFFTRWTEEWRISTAMLQAVYERSVTVKGKYDVTYINSILADLHGKGVKTPDAAMRDFETFDSKPTAQQPRGKPQRTEPKASYDLGKFEEILSNTSLWD